MNTAYLSSTTVRLLLPEILLVLLATWTYVGGTFRLNRQLFRVVAQVGLLLAGWALFLEDREWIFLGHTDVRQVTGPLLIDYFGHMMRWVALLVGWCFVLMTPCISSEDLATEYLGSLLLVVAGLLLVCGVGELTLLFLGLELIAIPTYILLFLGQNDVRSQEATLKYFFLSIFTSAILLYGFSFLYGIGGSTRLTDLQTVFASQDMKSHPWSIFIPLAMILIFAGLGFKMAVVPFHFYAPDVYQGTTNVNAGLLAVVPKIAGLIVLIRIVVTTMPVLASYGWQVSLVVAAITMVTGNVLALWQNHIRRLLAYSSIAHAGYMFIGLSVALAMVDQSPTSRHIEGIAAALFYLLVYVLATLGTFAALAYLGAKDKQIDGLEELAGLAKTHPVVAAAIAVFMFSLTGIPPLAGFWGKFVLLAGALSVHDTTTESSLHGWFVALAVVAALNAAIAAGYYLRVVGVMYFRRPVHVPRAQGGDGPWLVAVGAALLVVVCGLLPGRLIIGASRASTSLFTPLNRRQSEETVAMSTNQGPAQWLIRKDSR